MSDDKELIYTVIGEENITLTGDVNVSLYSLEELVAIARESERDWCIDSILNIPTHIGTSAENVEGRDVVSYRNELIDAIKNPAHRRVEG